MIYGDYHTHTVFSHGKGSMEDNVRAAVNVGLKEIAITDHGPRHVTAGVKIKRLPDFFAEAERLGAAYPQIRIFTGIEANFLSPRGEIDVPAEYADKFDVIVCGYHKVIKPLKAGDIGFFLANLVCKNTKSTLVRNTDAYINALEKNDIDIISHPDHDCRIDLRAVGEAAAAKGTLLELNGKRVSLTADELVMLADLGCRFIMDSDAHTPEKVGDVSIQMKAYAESGLPSSLVVNLDKAPSFRRGKEKEKRRL